MTSPAPIAGQTDLTLSPEDGTSSFSAEYEPALATGTQGGFVAIWDDFLPQAADRTPPGYPAGYGIDTDGGTTIMVRAFGAKGAPLGAARPVTADLTGTNSGAGAIGLSNGNVAIGWDMIDVTGSSSRIGARIITPATGASVGAEIVVATAASAFADGVSFAGVVALPGGRAGVLFVDGAGADRLRLAVIEANGTAGPVSTLLTAGASFLPAIGPTDLVVALRGANAGLLAITTQVFTGPDAGETEIVFRSLDGGAAPLATLNLGATGGVRPAVVALADGGFATALSVTAAAGSLMQRVQRYDAQGNAVGSATEVAMPYGSFDPVAELLALPDGGLILAVAALLPGNTDSNIYAQRIAADGSLDGGIVALSGTPPGFQTRPSLALTTDNDLVAAWEDARNPFNPEIHATRFELGRFADADETLRGTAAGDTLNGLGGNDLVDGLNGNDALLGGLGNDTLLGGNGGDTLLGGIGNDVLSGGNGRDRLQGGGGHDMLRGGNGPDLLLGEAGRDTLRGEAGSDRLLGGAEADLLQGGSGADTLEGGSGADRLQGDSGPDRFLWRSTAESLPATSDRVLDFGGGDRLDLSAIDADPTTPGNGAFAFIGAAGFAGGAGVAQLRVVVQASQTVILVDDGDADALPDMRILLTGRHALTEADFVL